MLLLINHYHMYTLQGIFIAIGKTHCYGVHKEFKVSVLFCFFNYEWLLNTLYSNLLSLSVPSQDNSITSLFVGSGQQGINKTETSQLNLLEYLQPNDPTDHLSLIALSLPLPIFIYAVCYVIQVF